MTRFIVSRMIASKVVPFGFACAKKLPIELESLRFKQSHLKDVSRLAQGLEDQAQFS
ncbi:MAG: hypothetical protein JJ956_02925 [Pseudomonadales bacterium]|nr:hypothetical protein [Pseudomonadales bacterium]